MTVEDPEPADRDRVRRSALAVTLWLLVPLIVVAAYVAQILESFSAVGCEGACDLALAFGARAVFQAGLAPMYPRNDRIANGEVPAEAIPPLPEPVGGWEASVDGATFLSFSSDGTVTDSDGCNDLSCRWSQDSAGEDRAGDAPPPDGERRRRDRRTAP